MRPALWSALAALLLVLSFPPMDLGWLGFVAAWPWCRLARSVAGRRLFLWGYVAGAVSLAIGCRWLAASSPWNLLGMVLFEALYYGGLAVVLRGMLVRGAWPAVLALPAAWVAMECGRRHFPLEGFPWLFLGYTQHSWIAVLQVSDLGGVFLLSALVAAVAGSLEDVLRSRSARQTGRAALPAVLLLLAAWLYGTFRLEPDEDGAGARPRVLVVQANVPQALKGAAMTDADLVRRYVDWTRRGLADAGGAVDLIVWPETMAPRWTFGRGGPPEDVWVDGEKPFRASDGAAREREFVDDFLVSDLLQPSGAWILLGALSYAGDVRRGDDVEYNSAFLLDVSGARRGVYDKRFRVPGGEYLPLIGALPDGLGDWVRDRVRSITGGWLPRLEAGSNPPTMSGPPASEPLKWGVSICYDIAYPSLGREAVEQGSQVFVNLSNEAWFPDTAEFAQYTAMAACRAAEVKRSIVRCANSGTSAGIDPYGRVHRLLGPDGEADGIPGTLLVRPEPRSDRTLYARIGDWPAWAACLTTLLLLIRTRRAAGRE